MPAFLQHPQSNLIFGAICLGFDVLHLVESYLLRFLLTLLQPWLFIRLRYSVTLCPNMMPCSEGPLFFSRGGGSGENSCRAKTAEEKNHARGAMEKNQASAFFCHYFIFNVKNFLPTQITKKLQKKSQEEKTVCSRKLYNHSPLNNYPSIIKAFSALYKECNINDRI